MRGILSIQQMNALKPGMVIRPDGTLVQQNPGYAVPAGGTTSVNAALGGNTLLYIGLGVIGLFAVSMMKGGR
jgi:hypothetical protein